MATAKDERQAGVLKEADKPWWLDGGDEECPHCGRRYHAEVEHRCAGCDCPGCIHCLGVPEKLCHDCSSEGNS